jgi:glycerol-3-phosphate dehydrogenase (NAD(P)+)
MKISVMGAGSWGTALAHQLARRGHDVNLWAREQEVAEGINQDHRNPLFMADMPVDPGVAADTDVLPVGPHLRPRGDAG